MLSLSIPNEVKVVAVTKGQSVEKIKEIINKNNITILGENYIQEAVPKINYFKSNKLEWHFIGRIQANKTRLIAQHFDWVQSVDRKKVATRLNNQRSPELGLLNICIEINESTEKLEELISHIQALPRLKWRGLMTMVTKDYEKTAKLFYDLKKQGYDIDTLSMGMSQDYEQAIKLGATMVRIGTLIFGERKS